ncbi:MAG TPA: ATP-binding cassette domain-containing protein [Candidatus Spyradocola merdavium]|nr:ATP-binding cassette domain-containing protein [Candidatus Spyradocola merdavium]
MIELDALTFRYAGAKEPALRSLSLRVPRGGFLGILGPSRSGKTTLLSALSGAVPHHRPGGFYGACRVGGLDTVEHTPTDLSRIVGSVFQDIDAQMVSSLVEDELLFALENFGVPQGELDGRIREALSAVGIEDLRHRSLDTLSGGQKQKVAIAAVLAMRPQVLALDEPTGELDPASSAAVFSLLSALNARGVTIVVAEQKLSLLTAHCKTLCVLDSGSIALQGDVREVLSQPRRLEALGLRVPRIAALHGRLAAAGLPVGPVPLTVSEAISMAKGVLA